MSRSLKKGYYVDPYLLDKIEKVKDDKKKKHIPIKTWSRRSMIIPSMVGLVFAVHNGREFIIVYVVENMVGCKLGEFSMTRTFKQHAGDRKANRKK